MICIDINVTLDLLALSNNFIEIQWQGIIPAPMCLCKGKMWKSNVKNIFDILHWPVGVSKHVVLRGVSWFTLWRTGDLGMSVSVLLSPYEHVLFSKGLSLSPFALLLLCGSFTSGHWLVCSNSFPHWVHYEYTCCFALVVEIIMIIYCMPSPR